MVTTDVIEDPAEKIYHDSVSRFLEMIILITSFVPSGKAKKQSHSMTTLLNIRKLIIFKSVIKKNIQNKVTVI